MTSWGNLISEKNSIISVFVLEGGTYDHIISWPGLTNDKISLPGLTLSMSLPEGGDSGRPGRGWQSWPWGGGGLWGERGHTLNNISEYAPDLFFILMPYSWINLFCQLTALILPNSTKKKKKITLGF